MATLAVALLFQSISMCLIDGIDDIEGCGRDTKWRADCGHGVFDSYRRGWLAETLSRETRIESDT